MTTPLRWTVLLFLALSFKSAAAPLPSHRQWRVYSGDLAGHKYSSLEQINTSNVQRLRPAWIFRCDDARQRPASTIECNPIIIDDVLYLTTPGLKTVALKAVSGEKIWEFDPWNGRGGRGVNRGLTFWENGDERRLFFAPGQYLYALDPKTGLLVPSFGQNGRIDLREGLDMDVFFLSVSATSPGIVYRDLIIMGCMVGEGPGPAAPGHIRAFDVRTGQRRWIFHTIPHPGEFGAETWPAEAWKTAGGANAWGGFTLDLDRGLVFCGTGSPAYDHYGGNRPGQNLFGNCILALHAATGQRAWHYQVVHHDLWDYDIPCPPNLVTIERNGQRVDVIAQPTKLGHLIVLDRQTGKPIFPIEERPVPRSDLPGEQSWPTQPFPINGFAYAQQRFTTNEVTDLSPAARDDVLRRLRDMRTGDVFLPPGLTSAVTLPQFNGGTDWGGAAVDPETGILYVNASNEAEWISMVPARPATNATLGQLGQHLYRVICSNCHGAGNPQLPPSPALTSLKDVKSRLTSAQLAELLETGRGQMPSFSSLGAIEKRALVSFLCETDQDEKVAAADVQLSWANEIPFVATGHNEFRDPEGYPVNKRPWGTLSAIDLNRGEILWQSPLGTYPKLEAQGHPPTGTFNMGGPVVTAGGLVFIGAARDERFHAYDKKTGKLLWEFAMEAGGYATPATFESNGKQFVIIAAGGGGKPETKPGNAYYCFALP